MTLDEIMIKLKDSEFPQDFKFKRYDKVKVLATNEKGIIYEVMNYGLETITKYFTHQVMYTVIFPYPREGKFTHDIYPENELEKVE